MAAERQRREGGDHYGVFVWIIVLQRHAGGRARAAVAVAGTWGGAGGAHAYARLLGGGVNNGVGFGVPVLDGLLVLRAGAVAGSQTVELEE